MKNFSILSINENFMAIKPIFELFFVDHLKFRNDNFRKTLYNIDRGLQIRLAGPLKKA